MELDTNKTDDAVLALLYLGLHDEARAWKGFDWDGMDSLPAVSKNPSTGALCTDICSVARIQSTGSAPISVPTVESIIFTSSRMAIRRSITTKMLSAENSAGSVSR